MLEEFREARHRELARLNVRLSSTIGKQVHTAEDLELLEGDTVHKRWLDMDVVRRWSADTGHAGP
jgi:hypothetical protein